MTPISLVTAETHLYHVLRDYKGPKAATARAYRRQLAEVLGDFLERHRACLQPGVQGVETVATVATVVPSLRRPGSEHPLLEVARRAGFLPVAGDLISPGPGSLSRSRAVPDAFRADPDASGRRIVLLDDVYTTGAHLQAAARALVRVGGEVAPVVIGRMVRKGWKPSAPVIEWVRSHRWSPDHCIHCSPSSPANSP